MQIFLGITVALWLVFGGLYAYLYFMPAPEPTPVETTERADNDDYLVGASAFPELQENSAYVEAQRMAEAELEKDPEERDYTAVVAKYLEAAEAATSPNEEAQARFMAALYKKFTDPIGAIRDLRALAENANVTSSVLRAAAVEHMGLTYFQFPTTGVFNEIFAGEYRILLAAPDAKPTQVDASITNLFEFGTAIHPLASLELELANAKVNANVPLTQKLVSYCQNVDVIQNDICVPNIQEVLTAEERVQYVEIGQYVQRKLASAERDIENRRDAENLAILARTLANYAKVKNKVVLYGVTTPEEVEEAFEEAIAFSQEHGFIDIEAITTLNYAVFIRLWWWSDWDTKQEKMYELLARFYEEDRFAKSNIAESLAESYQAELFGHSITHAMAIRGPVRLAEVDPRFRQYLIEEANWDFEGAPVQRHVRD